MPDYFSLNLWSPVRYGKITVSRAWGEITQPLKVHIGDFSDLGKCALRRNRVSANVPFGDFRWNMHQIGIESIFCLAILRGIYGDNCTLSDYLELKPG